MALRTASLLAAALLASAGIASAQNYGQLGASAGLSRSEAAGLPLDTLAAYHFNRNLGASERQTVPGDHASAPATDLDAAAAAHFNRNLGPSERQTVRSAATPSTVTARNLDQLGATAGLPRDGGDDLTLDAVAAAFFARTSD